MPPDIGDPVYGRRGGHVTITLLPKFVILIGYQICLAMVLRWRTTHAGFAIKGMRATAELWTAPLRRGEGGSLINKEE